MTGDRPAAYISGVVVPPRIARILDQRLALTELRIASQGQDGELYEILVALRWSALAYDDHLERRHPAKFEAEPAKSRETTPALKGQIDVATAAVQLRLSPRRVQQLAAAGEFEAVRLHGRWSLNADAVHRYLRSA